jgi:hypothetical protein
MPDFVDIQDFARRVERLCDFFIAKIREEGKSNGSDDFIVLMKLREDAANLQFTAVTSLTILGLDSYMRGILEPGETKE